MMSPWFQPLLGSVSRFAIAASGGGGGEPGEASWSAAYADGPVFPDNIPRPVVWLTPRDVVLNGSNKITQINNRGSSGATNHAAALSTAAAVIAQPSGWGGRDAIQNMNATFDFGSADVRTIISLATYKTGVEATFDNYDGFVSGPLTGSIHEAEIVGFSGTNRLFGKMTDVYIDGVALADPDGDAVLPMNRKGLAGVQTVAAEPSVKQSGALFRDNFNTSRTWDGLTGDILLFTEELTPAQIADVHAALDAYYGGAAAAAAGPTVRGHSKASALDTTPSMSLAYPAGIQAGDVLLLAIMDDDTTNTTTNFNVPAGFTQRRFEGGMDTTFTLMTKVADGSETGSLTVARNGNDDREAVAFLLAIQDADTTGNPIRDEGLVIGATNTSVNGGGIDTTANNALVIALHAFDGADAGTITVDGPDYTLLDSEAIGPGSIGVSASVATRAMGAQGSTGSVTFRTQESDGQAAFQFAFHPA